MATKDVPFLYDMFRLNERTMLKWKVQIWCKISANVDNFLKDEFIVMTFDLKAMAVYIFKGIGYYWMNEKKR